MPKHVVQIGTESHPAFLEFADGWRGGEPNDEVMLYIEGFKPLYKVSLVDGEVKHDVVAHKRNVDAAYGLSVENVRKLGESLILFADEVEQHFKKIDEKHQEHVAKRKEEGYNDADAEMYSTDDLLEDVED